MDIVTDYLHTILGFIKILPALAIGFVFGWLVIKIIIFVIRHTIKFAKVPKDIQGLIITMTKLALWVFLVIIISGAAGLGNLAIAISGSAAVAAFFLSASIGPLLSNIFAGLFLAGDPDIKVGMRVITNDGKTTGTIKGIDMRKVRIEGDDGHIHVVPNSAVENTEWIVLERKVEKKK